MSGLGAPQSRAAFTAVGAVVGAVLVLLSVVWTASIGPDGVFAGDGPSSVRTPPSPSTAVPTPSPAPESATDEPAEREETPAPPGWLKLIALLSQIATGLVLLYVAFRVLVWLRRRWTERDRRSPPRPHVDFEVLEGRSVEEATEEVVAGASEQREILSTGEPRNAIVACWHRFEVQAQRAGMQPEAWETSAEFTLRVLDRISADQGAVAELAGLYREARFSDHMLGEPDRARAVRALDQIHNGLSIRLGPGTRP